MLRGNKKIWGFGRSRYQNFVDFIIYMVTPILPVSAFTSGVAHMLHILEPWTVYLVVHSPLLKGWAEIINNLRLRCDDASNFRPDYMYKQTETPSFDSYLNWSQVSTSLPHDNPVCWFSFRGLRFKWSRFIQARWHEDAWMFGFIVAEPPDHNTLFSKGKFIRSVGYVIYEDLF